MTEGDRAWIGLLTYVVAYDTWAIRRRRMTLSRAFHDALDNPVRRWPTVLVWAAITIHLFERPVRRVLRGERNADPRPT